MTLKAAQEASGLSSTHLSEIERGRTSPTIGALIRIADAYQVDPSLFLDDAARPPFLLATPGTTSAPRASAGVAGGRLSWTCLHLEPGSEQAIAPNVEAAGFVASGSVLLATDGSKISLATGDSFHDRSSGRRVLKNRGVSAARVVLVTAPCRIV